MWFKIFLQNVMNIITLTIYKKKQVINKNDGSGLLKNNPVDINVNQSSTNTSPIHIELLRQISLSQLDKAILAATQIQYREFDVDKTDTKINEMQDSTKQKINIKVNADLLPLPAGLIAILDICNSPLYTFTNTN
jgi:hypothetical protein